VSSTYDPEVDGDVDIAPVAALLGDPARAAIVGALHEGRSLPAGELARRAGVSASTASEHLAKLVGGGLLVSESSGRHRYFRLAGPGVAHAFEALSALAPRKPVHSLRGARIGDALAEARTCYDHLAGRLGVAIADSLLSHGAVVERDGCFELGPAVDQVLATLGLSVAALPGRRPAVLRCLDWSERRPHLAGALGTAICAKAFEAEWIERLPGSRAVRVTTAGKQVFAARLNL
jgi:DNA-binding transcriptional ArsR family regulator